MNINYPVRPYGVSANRLFTLADALSGNRSASVPRGWVPPVDVMETENQYQLSAEIPGVSGNEVKVVVREGVLTLSGDRPAGPLAEGSQTHLSERRFGAFQRRFRLPKDADGECVSAEFKNGVLTIFVPKRETVAPKEIEVRVS
jgi:HSP20 family protein